MGKRQGVGRGLIRIIPEMVWTVKLNQREK